MAVVDGASAAARNVGSASRAARIDWERLKPSTIAIESAHATLALAALAAGWMTFPLRLLRVGAELSVTVALSGARFGERSRSRHVVEMLMIGMFLAIFVGFIPGIPLAALRVLAWPEVAADIGSAAGGCRSSAGSRVRCRRSPTGYSPR